MDLEILDSMKEAKLFGQTFFKFIDEGKYLLSYMMLSKGLTHQVDLNIYHFVDGQSLSETYSINPKRIRNGLSHGKGIEKGTQNAIDVWGGTFFRVAEENWKVVQDKIQVDIEDGSFVIGKYGLDELNGFPEEFIKYNALQNESNLSAYSKKIEEKLVNELNQGNTKFHNYNDLIIKRYDFNPDREEALIGKKIIESCIGGEEKKIRKYVKNKIMQLGALQIVEKPEYIGEVSFEGTQYSQIIDFIISYKSEGVYFSNQSKGKIRGKFQIEFGFKNKKLVTFIPFKGGIKYGDNYYFVNNINDFHRELNTLNSIK